MGSAEQEDLEILTTKWQPVGPNGGDIRGISLNPQNKNEIYAVIRSCSGQVYRSTNGGSTWTRIAVLNDYTNDVVVDPTNPSIVYVLGNYRVFKTTDRGLTWVQYKLPNTGIACEGQLEINPINPNILLAAGSGYYDTITGKTFMAVFKSADGGQTWSYKQLTASGSDYGYTNCLAVSKSNPNIIYVGGYYHTSSGWHSALYKSVDGGNNYSNKTGSIQYYPYSVACHPTDPNKLFVATYRYIYRSANGGNNWQKNSGVAYGYTLAIDSSNPNVLYAGHHKAIFKSGDGGFNWIEHKTGLYGTCNRLLVNLSKVYFCSSAGIYKSTNGGVAWASASTGIKSPNVDALAIAPSSPTIIYTEARSNGFFKSTNSGTSWRRMPYFERCDAVLRIAVKSTDAKSVYILAGGLGGDNICRSVDGGTKWTMILADNCEDLVINKNNFNHIFIAGSIWSNGADYAALHKSLNGGNSWTHKKISTSKNSYGYAVAIHPSNDNMIYVGASVSSIPTVFKSTNGGSSWSKTALIGGYAVLALAIDPNTPSRIYAGTGDGISCSTNSGSSWTWRGSYQIKCLKINPNNPSIIYAGGSNGVYVSTDYGNTWNEFNEGLTIKDVQWLDIDKPHKILYAATAGGGVYKRNL